MSADPRKPYPNDKWPIEWTPERVKWWAQSQALGIQYYTGFGPVYCPPRTWEKINVKTSGKQ